MEEPIIESEAPSQVVINGTEYSPEDAQSLIELGSKTRELEKQWNTPVDKVWPEYGKSREQIKQYESELATAKTQLAEFQTKQQRGVETPSDIKEAQEAARKVGLILNEDLEKSGYVKKEELDSYFSKKQEEQRAVQAIFDEADRMAKEINATDTPAKFNKKAVIAYANAYGKDLREAYEEMHEEVLKPWKEAKVALSKAKGLQTLKPGGKKEYTVTKPRDNEEFKARLHESLWGSEEGK